MSDSDDLIALKCQVAEANVAAVVASKAARKAERRAERLNAEFDRRVALERAKIALLGDIVAALDEVGAAVEAACATSEGANQ